MWSELLGVDRISRNDSFFALGGHSLLAVRLLSRLPDAIGTDLPLAALFANPTLAGIAHSVSEELAQSGVQASTVIERVDRAIPLELSHAQERLWFLSQFEGVSKTYHIPLAMRLRGRLNEPALRNALDRLWARHEGWRYTFTMVEGEPRATLLPTDAGLLLREHDLRHEGNAGSLLDKICAEEANAPFDLERGPLVRGRLIRLADDEHMLLLTQHHIVSDGWSMGVLNRELEVLYAALASGRPDPLPELSVQYPDYAAWQRRWLSGERQKSQADYWRAKLTDAPTLITLPTDRPRPAQQNFTGARIPIVIDAALTSELKRLSLKNGTTLFMTVLAAWSTVLSRLSGQDDIVIGTPVANRGRPELEGLIGFFVNMLALRIDVSGNPDGTTLLRRVRETILQAQDHQSLPFEQVVEAVQPPRRLDHTPVFQVMLAWNEQRIVPTLSGVAVDPADTPYRVSKFDLEMALYETDDRITGSLGYATALFDAETIERHVGYLLVMLRGLVALETKPLHQLDILPPSERTLLLEEWNRTDHVYPSERCVHQLFEDQVS
ncbi:condensation domain-containing protein, partial [Agrobacterium sp. P15N1-A]